MCGSTHQLNGPGEAVSKLNHVLWTRPLLKESSADSSSHSWNTSDSPRTVKKSRCSRARDIACFVPHILLPCQNQAPTLPTMQLFLWQWGARLGCVKLVAVNVAWSLQQRRGAAEVWTHLTHFLTCRLQPTLTQVTSLKDIYQTWHSWRR